MDKRIDSRAVLATVAALALGVTLIYSVTTSGAQFAASTNNSSNEFWAGQIDVSTNLVQPVLLVSDGIYPGIQIQECMDVSYVGTITGVSTRMYASAAEGGLGEFLDIEIEAGQRSSSETTSCEDFVPRSADPLVFAGTLAAFSDRHSSFDDGFDLGLSNPADTVTLRITAEVQDDNAAQGLSADFSFFLEGRP